MVDDTPDPLEAAMRTLRAEYLYEAPERVRELSAALGRLRAGEASALGDIGRCFHRLAGSGGSYGFPEITERSRTAEHAVIRWVGEARAMQRGELEIIEQYVLNIAEAFQMAQREFDAEAPPT